MPSQITISAIESKVFKQSTPGYDSEEVDTFLDDICDEMERMINESGKLQQQLREAQMTIQRLQQQQAAKPQEAPRSAAPAAPESDAGFTQSQEESFREILVLAQKVKNETIQAAQEKASKMLEEAEQKASEQLAPIEEKKESLNRQVEALKQTVADYRSRFEALLQAQQEALDKVSDM